MKEKCTVNTGYENYNALDLAKFVFAFFIIAIHIAPASSTDTTVKFILLHVISRVAVPFYFACSGFFFFRKLSFKNGKILNCIENRTRLLLYCKRLVLLYSFWSAVYLLWQIPQWYFAGTLTPHSFLDFFISFFLDASYYHLWYLLATLFAVPAVYLFLSMVRIKFLAAIAICFYLFGVFSYSYFWIDLPVTAAASRVNDFLRIFGIALFRAFPFITVGVFAEKYRFRLRMRASASLALICLTLCAVEAFLLKNLTENQTHFSYLFFTLPTAFFIFYTLKSCKLGKRKNNLYPMLRKLSTFIYCVHPLVLNVLSLALDCQKYQTAAYLIVAAGSALLGVLIVKLSSKKYLSGLKYLY